MITATEEFERQLANLVALGYPGATGRDEAQFRALFEGLREPASRIEMPQERPEGQAPFVLVVRTEVLAPELAMTMTTLGKGPGFTDLTPASAGDFRAIDSVLLPAGAAYLVARVDTGTKYLDVRPEDALRSIQAAGRSPLTLEEGVALVTQFPALLRKNACFSLSGARAGDQRVPAIWISSGRPRLGWCWDRNPHSWLGSASCAGRVASGSR